MKRRDFVKLGGLTTLAMFLDKNNIVNASETIESKKVNGIKVDFHAHPIIPSYVNGLEKLGINANEEEGFPLPKWTIENHLEFMDKAQIDYTILSVPTPHIYNGNDKLSRDVARKINEEMAGICQKYPKKFGFVAVLPMPNIEYSIEEIRYAKKYLKSLGVKVASNSYGIYLGDSKLEAIFEELNNNRELVIIHPSPARQLPRENVITGKVMALFEYPVDTTRAVLNMLSNGTLTKFPNIKFIVPHCGSFLPYMKYRAGAMFKMLANMQMMPAVDINQDMEKLYFDLAGDPNKETLNMLLNITNKNHIVYGSDFPYVSTNILLKKKKILDIELTKRLLLDKVYYKNAKKILD